MAKRNNKKVESALEVKHISKSFRLPTERADGIKQAVINYFRGIKGYKEQHVLNNITFTVEKGDFFGIVGRNGSGKSTLLKLISQIYQPDSGDIVVNGKLVPFIELGVGFNHELTGRENIYMNGALLGFSHEEMTAMYDDIVNFAELHEFMDQKLKNYSSGMQVRLAFSIAIKADADILVLDEVLAVGDEAFQRKCFQYFALLKKQKRTVVLVTHSMEHVVKFCNKAALIDKGHKLVVGKPAEIAQIYRGLNMEEGNSQIDSDSKKPAAETSRIIGTKVNDIAIKLHHQLRGDRVVFDLQTTSKVDLKDVVITFVITKDTGEPVYRWVTDEKYHKKLSLLANQKVSLQLDLQNIFPDGEFGVQIGIKKRDRTEEYVVVDDCIKFTIINKDSPYMYDVYWKPDEKYSMGV